MSFRKDLYIVTDSLDELQFGYARVLEYPMYGDVLVMTPNREKIIFHTDDMDRFELVTQEGLKEIFEVSKKYGIGLGSASRVWRVDEEERKYKEALEEWYK